MSPDVTTAIAAMPPWLQGAASVAVFVLTVLIGLRAVRQGSKDAEEHHLDPAELLASSPVKALVDAIVLISEHQRLQTEALKVTSAALTALAKLIEDDFDERRVHREVERRLAERRAAPPQSGWGGP
jgi:hypothetical protein